MDATKDSQLAIDFAKAAGFGAFVSKRSGLRAESCKDMQVLIVCFVGGGDAECFYKVCGYGAATICFW